VGQRAENLWILDRLLQAAKAQIAVTGAILVGEKSEVHGGERAFSICWSIS
jgi:hypothetical protein